MNKVTNIAFWFIVFTIVGTLTHELGHYAAGKFSGLNCTIHFASCRCLAPSEEYRINFARDMISQYGSKDSIPPEVWQEYQTIIKSMPYIDRLWTTIGGPLQTVSTGLIGFIALLIRKRKNQFSKFNGYDWLLVYLSLFWIREPFNLFLSIVKKLIIDAESFFGGDELKISRGLNLWDGTIPIIMGLIGLAICLIVIFKLIPKSNRKNFIIGGLLGGTLAYLLWMKLLGPILLP